MPYLWATHPVFILKEGEFLDAIEKGLTFALLNQKKLLTLVLNRPETGYDYIQIASRR